MKQPSPESPHAAYNHDSPNDADTLVLGHSAGELFADHNVYVILKGETKQKVGHQTRGEKGVK